ncbi:MarR family transcriptional regulator [Microbacterium kribbense]|uniref:MarR family transcriptional regulator n=1 Tax=Microbacterium kribbense TaxID=433645 RepID=A0ABP7G1X0_9MICO
MGQSAKRRRRTSALTETIVGHDVPFLLARTNTLSLAAVNTEMTKHRLTARSYAVLALAVSDTRPTQRQLGEFLMLHPSQVVAVVDQLEERGWVRRELDSVDRRSNVIVATDEGRAGHEVVRVAVESASAHIFGDLSEQEFGTLSHLLRRLAFPVQTREVG